MNSVCKVCLTTNDDNIFPYKEYTGLIPIQHTLKNFLQIINFLNHSCVVTYCNLPFELVPFQYWPTAGNKSKWGKNKIDAKISLFRATRVYIPIKNVKYSALKVP